MDISENPLTDLQKGKFFPL